MALNRGRHLTLCFIKYILVEFFQGILNLNMLFPANASMNSILN